MRPAGGGSGLLTGSAVPALSVAGGFGLRFFSLILETATSNEINRELPSDQRATLISVSSILFSIAMIAATPALSFLCEALGTSIAFAISGAVLGVTAACLLFLGKSAFFPVSGKAVSSHTKGSRNNIRPFVLSIFIETRFTNCILSKIHNNI